MRHLIPILGLVALVASVTPARAQHPSIYTMVAELREQSRSDALTIKEEYRPLMDSTMFEDEEALWVAQQQGELVPLSSVELPQLQPRLWGHSPIAERDLENQALYVALRPATMGMLVDITRRVEHGPVEVTSAVRSAEYQRALMRGNSNANTDVPTHVMGYAVDIGLKYASEETAKDLRRVLEDLRDSGDIYFIAESNQLTFHAVPVPSRMHYFETLYEQTLAAEQRPEIAPLPVPEPHPVGVPETDPGFFGEVWSWITGLFD